MPRVIVTRPGREAAPWVDRLRAHGLDAAALPPIRRAPGGSCALPLAAHARWSAGLLCIDAAWGDPDQRRPMVRAQASAAVETLAQAEALGADCAARLRAAIARQVAPNTPATPTARPCPE